MELETGRAVNSVYERPASIDEAVGWLGRGGFVPLAGGTDLYPAHVGRPLDFSLLDLTGIDALRGIRHDGSGSTFGATTTWAEVQRADLPPLFNALKQAAREIGGAQIQNAGTLAGNLCNASPAADGTPVWLALGARVRLRSPGHERELNVGHFVLGHRRTARAADELVTALHVPARSPRSRSVFIKLGGRRYLTISMTMVALTIDVDAAGRLDFAGVAVGSCAARAVRLPALERKLLGQPRAALAGVPVEAGDLEPLAPLDDLRASAAYRRDATATLLRRALRDLQA